MCVCRVVDSSFYSSFITGIKCGKSLDGAVAHNFFSHSQRRCTRLEQAGTVRYTRGPCQRGLVSLGRHCQLSARGAIKRIPYSVQHLAYPTLCPPRYRVYDSLDANCNCKRFLNPIRHVCSFAVVGSFMRTATPNVIPNTTRLLTKHTRASSQGIHSALGQQRLTRGRFSPGEVALHRSLRH